MRESDFLAWDPCVWILKDSDCVGSVHTVTGLTCGMVLRLNVTMAQVAQLPMDVYSLDGVKHHSQTEEYEKRNFINDLYSSSYGDKAAGNIMAAINNALVQSAAIPANAARHPLV
ncbi:hypothetical protein OS493_040292 [Desmophyllum pertusum]|uniref:Uncharacterized protein n=1 Tax=Desmophyllum pertusum TaxID=174260 RepID=A0A9W9ZW39_9CNID|nr:hypothetical protein OS493_040292 [Desmophyllum pertusum]